MGTATLNGAAGAPERDPDAAIQAVPDALRPKNFRDEGEDAERRMATDSVKRATEEFNLNSFDPDVVRRQFQAAFTGNGAVTGLGPETQDERSEKKAHKDGMHAYFEIMQQIEEDIRRIEQEIRQMEIELAEMADRRALLLEQMAENDRKLEENKQEQDRLRRKSEILRTVIGTDPEKLKEDVAAAKEEEQQVRNRRKTAEKTIEDEKEKAAEAVAEAEDEGRRFQKLLNLTLKDDSGNMVAADDQGALYIFENGEKKLLEAAEQEKLKQKLAANPKLITYDKLDQAAREYIEKAQKAATHNDNVQTQEKIIQQCDTRLQEIDRFVRASEEILSDNQDRMERLQKQIEKNNAKLEELERQNKELAAKGAQQQEELKELQEKIKEAKEKLEEKQRELGSRKKDQEKLTEFRTEIAQNKNDAAYVGNFATKRDQFISDIGSEDLRAFVTKKFTVEKEVEQAASSTNKHNSGDLAISSAAKTYQPDGGIKSDVATRNVFNRAVSPLAPELVAQNVETPAYEGTLRGNRNLQANTMG